MLSLLLTLAAAYLIGAIPFGYILGRLVKGIDIRQHGSGNIGATNVGRVLGWKWFPLVLLLDIAKGALPVALIRFGGVAVDETALSRGETAALAGLAAMLGHLFPIYLAFKGGKGVATGTGVIGVLLPLPTLISVSVFVPLLAVTRYVSLSSIFAALALIVARLSLLGAASFDHEEWAATALALTGTALIILRHRANIRRLLAGTEPKIGKKSLAEESPQ